MEMLDENSHEKIMGSLKKDVPAEITDFFASTGDQDPHTRPPKKPMAGKFCCKVLFVTNGEDMLEYCNIMNKIVAGEYTHNTEETFHDKEGNIKILLKWMEWPEGESPNQQAPTDAELDAVVESDKRNDREKKRRERREKTEEKDKPDIPEPQITL